MEQTPKSVACKTRNMRFWLKPGESRSVVFATAEPTFCFLEHQVKLNDFRNWATCLKMIERPCELDEISMPYSAAAFTIFDITPYTRKDGTEVPYTKRLFIAKEAVWQKIMRQAEHRTKKGESLRGAMYTIFRPDTPMSPNTGDDFNFEEMVKLEELFEDSAEFDYATLLAPDPALVAYYAKMARRSPTQGGQPGAGAGQIQY